MRSAVTTAAEIAGAALACYGISLVDTAAALIAGGVWLLATGYVAGR